MRFGTRAFPRVVHLPNIPLELKVPHKLSPKQRKDGIRTVELKTKQWVSKPELKLFLRHVYGVEVSSLATANLEGERTFTRAGATREPGWKKVYATLKQPFLLPSSHLPAPDSNVSSTNPEQQ